jgi:hypothetical protein
MDEPRFINHLLLPAAYDQLGADEFGSRLGVSSDGTGKEPMKLLRRIDEHYGAALSERARCELRRDITKECQRFYRGLALIDPRRRHGEIRRTVARIAQLTLARLGGARWLVKQPDLSDHLEDLVAVFPNAHFVHVMRHPADVLASRVDRGYQPSFESAFAVWYSRLKRISQFARAYPGRLANVCFESLVWHTSETLEALWPQLGLSPHEAHESARDCIRLGDAHIGRGRGRFSREQARRIIAAVEEIDSIVGGGWLPEGYHNVSSAQWQPRAHGD